MAIRVKDNGSGISPQAMKRLFTPFFTTKPIGVGTGLGLSLCKDVVESFGGRIEVESEVGRGTTFQVLLNPAKNPSVLNNVVHLESGHSETIRGRILILDDDETLSKAIAWSLKSEHEVVIANSGRVALEKLNANPQFDLILCDIALFDMSGMDVYEKIKETCPGMENRFMFLTGGAFTQQAQEFLDSVTNPVLQKPFRPQQLRDAVRIQLQKLKRERCK